MKRQKLRKVITLVSFLLFPITMNYLSPYLVLVGASKGIVTGSLLMFALMFLASLFFGRAYCGWLCPTAAMQEVCRGINDTRVKRGIADKIKYMIWAPWLLGIVGLFFSAGGPHSVDPLFMTETGVSVDAPSRYVMYYLVVALFIGLAMLVGRRASCHTICWMAPFMVIGSRIRRLGLWPSLRLVADSSQCVGCKQCDRQCMMSLDVSAMVSRSEMYHDECILCGECVDHCPRSAIRFTVDRNLRVQKDRSVERHQTAAK